MKQSEVIDDGTVWNPCPNDCNATFENILQVLHINPGLLVVEVPHTTVKVIASM